MGPSFAGINLADSIVNAEFRIGVLERLVDRLIRIAPPGALTQEDFEEIRNEVFEQMKKRYPDAELTSKFG